MGMSAHYCVQLTNVYIHNPKPQWGCSCGPRPVLAIAKNSRQFLAMSSHGFENLLTPFWPFGYFALVRPVLAIGNLVLELLRDSGISRDARTFHLLRGSLFSKPFDLPLRASQMVWATGSF